jgi:alginate O-acetyltransferase complex protein AlgI
MLFQSHDFLILMLSLFLVITVIRHQTLQVVALLVASYIFYMSWNPIFALLIFFSTFKDYVLGLCIGKAQRRSWRIFWLTVSCVTSLGFLGFFKYYNFFINTFNQGLARIGVESLLPLIEIVLPVGISFYTFRLLSYIIDVFRDDSKVEKSFLRFATYVAFFPQLLAGPISRSTDFIPQLNNVLEIRHENLCGGCNLFLVGLVKKVLIVNYIAPLTNTIFSSPQGLPSILIWLGALAFTIQIYCDFSAYTDMARGAGQMLGFHSPINFNYPYAAHSIKDFWRRWHISLSSWLRDYLYIPLGGNRKGKLRNYQNLLATMALGGLWHGAGCNFIVWGIYHGVLLAIERAKDEFRMKVKPTESDAGVNSGKPKNSTHLIMKMATWLFVQYLVVLGWLIFRSQSWDDMLYCVRKFVIFDFNPRLSAFGLGTVNPFMALSVMLLFVILHIFSYRIGGIANRLGQMRWPGRTLVYMAAMFVLIVFWPTGRTSFIYFQF